MRAPRIDSKIAIGGEEFRTRVAHNRALADKLRADAKLLDIGAGTNEIRRMLIGRELIGA